MANASLVGQSRLAARQHAYSQEVQPPAVEENRFKKAVSDGAVGIGHGISKAFEYNLLQHITPRVIQFGSALPRLLGGAVTFVTSGFGVAEKFVTDLRRADGDFSRTRKEVLLTAASVGSGLLAGSLAGVVGATLLASGASAALLGGFTVASAVLVGGTAYRVRALVERWYDKGTLT